MSVQKRKKIVLLFLATIFVVIGILLAYNFVVVQPLFKQFLIKQIENESIRLASHLKTSLLTHNLPLDSPDLLKDKNIYQVQTDFKLMKLKIFLDSGKIVYSTDPQDVGKINEKDYFHDVVAKGNTYTKVVKKGFVSLEDQIVTLDVVETYVPIMKEGRFIGAFEIYFDITKRNESFSELIWYSNLILLFVVIFLIFGTIMAARKEVKLISEQETLKSKINTLEKLLPICANCKKIRLPKADAEKQESWQSVEGYISSHTESEFSHSICPECMKKLYPEVNENEK